MTKFGGAQKSFCGALVATCRPGPSVPLFPPLKFAYNNLN